MKQKVTTVLLIAAITAAAPLFAGSASSSLAVSVQVVARTIVTVDNQPATIQITASDVARGYVVLPQSVQFHVRSNAANGYLMQFQPVSYPFSRADVSWGTASATVGADGAWFSEPYQQGTSVGSLNVRLTLAADTLPGTYAWPVRFEAASL